MINKQKILLGFMVSTVLTLILSGCESAIQDQDTDDSQNDVIQADNQNLAGDEALTINTNRCSGCGKCVRIDPEHFALQNRQAEVISQDNLNSSSLDMAISICHDKAIELS